MGVRLFPNPVFPRLHSLILLFSSSSQYTSNDTPSARGELCMKGLNIMQGYYKDEKNTKEAIDEDGWFHTGDICTVDSQGRFRIIDRMKNIMKLAQ